MPFSKENTYTTDYIYSLPEGQRAELIDGVIYDMAPPNRLHQELVMNLSAEIREYISKNYGFCKVYPAPFAVFLNKDDKTGRMAISLHNMRKNLRQMVANIRHVYTDLKNTTEQQYEKDAKIQHRNWR